MRGIMLLLLLTFTIVPAANAMRALGCEESGLVLITNVDRYAPHSRCNEIESGTIIQWRNMDFPRISFYDEGSEGDCLVLVGSNGNGLGTTEAATYMLTYDPSLDRLIARGWGDERDPITRIDPATGDRLTEWACPERAHERAANNVLVVRWVSSEAHLRGTLRIRH